MHTTALTSAITLYRSGTLSLSQAAARSGFPEDDLVDALQRHGVTVREERSAVVAGSADHPASAD